MYHARADTDGKTVSFFGWRKFHRPSTIRGPHPLGKGRAKETQPADTQSADQGRPAISSEAGVLPWEGVLVVYALPRSDRTLARWAIEICRATRVVAKSVRRVGGVFSGRCLEAVVGGHKRHQGVVVNPFRVVFDSPDGRAREASDTRALPP